MTLDGFIDQRVHREFHGRETWHVPGVAFELTFDEFAAWFFECKQETLRRWITEWAQTTEPTPLVLDGLSLEQREWLKQQL